MVDRVLILFILMYSESSDAIINAPKMIKAEIATP